MIADPTLAERSYYNNQVLTIVDMAGKEITYQRAGELLDALKIERNALENDNKEYFDHDDNYSPDDPVNQFNNKNGI